ncbi:YncE family protein [Prauserella halophila]|uniref:YncE family protein n=1 Tax=Prauserella halophila TaxID=185641 RepID=UPI0020A59CF8
MAAALLLTGCSDAGGDQLQVVENPERAAAASSPATTEKPTGRVVPADGDVTAVAAADGTLAAALTGQDAVQLYDLGRLGAEPRTVSLPGEVTSLRAIDGDIVATMPDAGAFARIDAAVAEADVVELDGAPTGVAAHGDRTLVALRDAKAVQVLDADDRPLRTIRGELYSADDVLVGDGDALVLDRLRTAAFSVDVTDATIGEGLRAGQGAAQATTDEYGRVLVTDARNGALLAFDTEPLLLRQRHPVDGGAYGIAYDSRRHLAWVTLTERNEVVGYDVRGGQPEEKFRLPTVRQPDSVTVDERTSQVVIGSAAGEGIQVITP